MTKFKLRKKIQKIILSITAKPHAHIQTKIKKIAAKFQKDPGKIVGVLAFT